MRDWFDKVQDLVKETKKIDEELAKPEKTKEDYAFLIGYKTQCLKEALAQIEKRRKVVSGRNKKLKETQLPEKEKLALSKEVELEIRRLEEAEKMAEGLHKQIEKLNKEKDVAPGQVKKVKLPYRLAIAGIIVVAGFLATLGIGYFLQSPPITSTVDGLISWAESQGISMYIVIPIVAIGLFVILLPLVTIIVLERLQRS
ncbi:MAG: hypothetical protein JW744_04430 [Candidatus Diapherotrites archaeon]|uniref:Uncharacterized protein n=1 Tax=Candidatus Iainarchaeum sp. TaxID=3101447 RepID=A0A938YP25_9ARCH|nr:hypothetical protein [Candidatus Diapherotrites archaeon]